MRISCSVRRSPPWRAAGLLILLPGAALGFGIPSPEVMHGVVQNQILTAQTHLPFLRDAAEHAATAAASASGGGGFGDFPSFLASAAAASSSTTTAPPIDTLSPAMDTLSSIMAGDTTSLDAMSTSLQLALTTVMSGLFAQYKTELDLNPLRTKMLTGATISMLGDAIAQFSAGLHAQHTKMTQDKAKPIEVAEVEIELDGEGFELEDNDDQQVKFQYDPKRAVAFAAFDSVYRFAQHVLYPPVIEHFRGQYILWVLGTFEIWPSDNIYALMPDFFAAIEESLVAQLVIVPLIYYPVFYAVTALIQNLTVEQTIERAKETFVPLMKRNLMFWIPVQFAVFGFVEENLQVPALSVCSLVWVMILSFFAGSTGGNSNKSKEEEAAAALETVVDLVQVEVHNEEDDGVVVLNNGDAATGMYFAKVMGNRDKTEEEESKKTKESVENETVLQP